MNYKTAGKGIALSGIAFWLIAPIVVLVLIATPFLLPLVNSVEDNAAARRDREAANRAQADAMRIGAEAQADALLTLTAEGVAAIQADRRKAHPLQYAMELIVKGVAILAVMGVFTITGVAVIYRGNPDGAKAMVTFFSRRTRDA